MKTILRFQAILILLAVGAMGVACQAAKIISIDFTPDGSGMPLEEPAGAPGVRTANWNSAPMGGASTTLDLLDGTIMDGAGNAINGLSMTLFTGNSGNASQRGNPPGGVAPALQNDGRMFRTVTKQRHT